MNEAVATPGLKVLRLPVATPRLIKSTTENTRISASMPRSFFSSRYPPMHEDSVPVPTWMVSPSFTRVET